MSVKPNGRRDLWQAYEELLLEANIFGLALLMIQEGAENPRKIAREALAAPTKSGEKS